jgi:hypothetical protein
MNESQRKLQMQSLISIIKDAKKYILVITGPNFTKLEWMVCLMIQMHLTGMDVESEP